MKVYKQLDNLELVSSILDGKVGLLPTDTIYGLSCSIYDKQAVSRIYDIKGRNHKSPLIVLISDVQDLGSFRIKPDGNIGKLLRLNWPGKISFILPLKNGFEYITGDIGSISFRMPDDDGLRSLLQKTGPLVSTSANPSGSKPAIDVTEAKEYFGDKLDFYVDMGELYSDPSTLVDLTSHKPSVIRQGATAFKIE
jgi:L-threonylcarbamoyladenylate synthase